MHNAISNRREVYNEYNATPEALRPVKTLQELGILTPLKDKELYHGRSGDGSKWRVKEVDNSGNSTGNHNINKIPGLHTSEYNIASEFAEVRARRENERGNRLARPEVHRITSEDPDAGIIDKNFDWGQLSKLQAREARVAIRETLPGVFEGAPLDFQEKGVMARLSLEDFTQDRTLDGFISKDMVSQYAKEYNIPSELSEKICGAINARKLLGNYPNIAMGKVVDAFLENTGEAEIMFKDRGSQTLPINKEYVASWLQNIHVVGTKMWVHSGTLGKVLPTYVMFDHEHVNTKEENDRQRRVRNRRLGKIANHLAANGFFDEAQYRQRVEQSRGRAGGPEGVRQELINLYATPEELVAAAKEVPGYRSTFEADAGNWEKFSLGEHTETVLRFFEHNYADKLPVTVLPIMKLGLLVHDIGKPLAVKNHDKENQMLYNIPMASHFMQSIGIEKKTQDFVLKLIGEGKERVGHYLLQKNPSARELDEIGRFCAEAYEAYTGEKASDNTVNGVFDLCLMLQTCDSAAYTDMALTRARDKKGVYYRNYPSFNKSFKNERGLTGRRGKLKNT